MDNKINSKTASKQKILDSAKEIFAEVGFDGARVDEIAKRAQVNKALIYYYFKSKDDILKELINNELKEIMDLRESLLKNVNTLDEKLMENVSQALLSFLKKKKDILKIIMVETLKTDSKNISIFEFLRPLTEDILLNFEKLGGSIKDPLYIMVNSFFLVVMPLSIFVILEDKWAEYYNYDKENIDKAFLTAIRNNYIQSVMKYYNENIK